MKINILYENNDLMVIDKPALVSVHGDGKTKEYTIADWVLENYPEIKSVGEDMEIEIKGGEKVKISRPGIVHRLDKETSGVLLIAKNEKSFLHYKKQFQKHLIQKVYRAFVYGYVSDPKASLLRGKRGVINAPIGRSPKDIRAWTAGRGAREPMKEAITEYIVLKRFTDATDEEEEKDVNHQFSYIEAYPKTGRTHQIRVHMRYINHPIVSDPIYRGSKEKALGFDRLALHSYSVTFKDLDGKEITVESPLPKEFAKNPFIC